MTDLEIITQLRKSNRELCNSLLVARDTIDELREEVRAVKKRPHIFHGANVQALIHERNEFEKALQISNLAIDSLSKELAECKRVTQHFVWLEVHDAPEILQQKSPN